MVIKEIRPIVGKTALVGVIGWPIEHSLSPVIHNAAFAELGLDWAYVPLAVHPEQVSVALNGLQALNFVGVNVTLPHKQEVMRYIDQVSDAAHFMGAVNTIHNKNGDLTGYNTDASGFLNSLIEGGCQPEGLRVAVLGAGGAARAVVFALARAGAKSVVVLNRTIQRAAFLVDDLNDSFPSTVMSQALTDEALAELAGQVDLIVNTTSVGMYPDVQECPWPDDVPIPNNTVFYDLVYNPLETRLLARAREAGQITINGLGMLVHQGAIALKIWTGYEAPVTMMRAAALAKLQFKTLATD